MEAVKDNIRRVNPDLICETTAIRLRMLRVASGYSQSSWSEVVGAGTRTVQRWEYGQSIPQFFHEDRLIALCQQKPWLLMEETFISENELRVNLGQARECRKRLTSTS